MISRYWVVPFLVGAALLLANIVWVPPGDQYLTGAVAVIGLAVVVWLYRRLRPGPWLLARRGAPLSMYALTMAVPLGIYLAITWLEHPRSAWGWFWLAMYLTIRLGLVFDVIWDRLHPQSPPAAAS